MCGINGIVQLDRSPVAASAIDEMNEAIVHRGPDDRGVFVHGNVGLGHLRLSILDLSEKGHQPMEYVHDGKRVVITYNGEVYNYKEIRRGLVTKGYRFISNTDTEVLAAAYLEYGTDCLRHFNGMFAFVIYDERAKIIFGARDRFGQKPLKYYLNDRCFIFSSELKAILTRGVPRELDYHAIHDFLTLQYVPAPRTGFLGINKLPAAHFFVLDIARGDFTMQRYFDLNYTKKRILSSSEWKILIERKFAEAVEKRMIADVPLGAFLSGGVDSSAVVAFMSKGTKQVKTFSISFDEAAFDESKYARLVAERYHTDHTEFTMQAQDLITHIDDVVYQFEEPYADVSQLPTYLLSQLTRAHVTVALSGDAGDENFGGYDKYRIHCAVIKYRFLLPLLHILRPFVRERRINVLLKTLHTSIARRHYNFTNYFDEWSKDDFYKEDIKEKLVGATNTFESILAKKQFDPLDKIMYLDFNSYLPDNINVKVDMASMKYALEVRSPMLDYEFAVLMAQMPWRYKLGVWQGKKIFKAMLENYLPRGLLYRKKHGFAVPIRHWFRGPLKEYLSGVVLDKDGLVLRLMEEVKVEKLIQEHHAGKGHEKKLWALLVLNMWYKKYFLTKT